MIYRNEEAQEASQTTLLVDGVRIYIPECCSQGLDSCTHSVKPPEKVKRNIAL